MIARVAPRIVAVDPGSESSGVVLFDPVCSEPVVYAAKVENDHLLAWLHAKAIPYDVAGWHHLTGPHVLVVEMMRARGMPFSNDEMRTLVWLGRFIEAWRGEWAEVYRQDVKLHLCGSAKARDANIRAALIDRFGGKDAAIGCKRARGRCTASRPMRGRRWRSRRRTPSAARRATTTRARRFPGTERSSRS